MCAIVDAGVASDVFGGHRTPAGEGFFKWLNEGNGKLVMGGKLQSELEHVGAFATWARQAVLAGRIKTLRREAVDEAATQLKVKGALVSNDHHVIAVARLSGARLLCAHDDALQTDFKAKRLIDSPRGKVFDTRTLNDQPQDFTKQHRRLLAGRSCDA